MSERAERELRAEGRTTASPAHVWAVLSDLDRMPAWSPELLRMVPLGGGGLRERQTYLGINRRKAVVWPTRNVVAAIVPERLLVWDTPSSGARWIWELVPTGDAGTTVVHRRPVPAGLPLAARVVAGLLMGGAEAHADELEEGMACTVERMLAAVVAG
ncbi:SRPBCC family protein [Nocardioides acrostichi]|uniref:SRPBCC family protein n=1 Tax=Nocardioides acrostichi TaxID=2784339 RepID=A0A930UWE5_9ACTN|nr:SRPBCC family protein [Nocardioides acrostichi]MBF4160300.1 SRPBCC family protein [Nocardioides acrostichi]